ncbi:MAG: hypothetical protein PWP76_629 [Candidatus Diapherotrites archaeon]|nr:hypothetical protein [Candidatus Diapherotrites archaeon]MDN5367059.1 hypothetical protein [Candidatus Diapherotrites archaeon]
MPRKRKTTRSVKKPKGAQKAERLEANNTRSIGIAIVVLITLAGFIYFLQIRGTAGVLKGSASLNIVSANYDGNQIMVFVDAGEHVSGPARVSLIEDGNTVKQWELNVEGEGMIPVIVDVGTLESGKTYTVRVEIEGKEGNTVIVVP